MKALTASDQMFLWLERRNQPMHVGGLQLVMPPPGAPEDFVAKLAQRCRQFSAAQKPFNQRLVKKFGVWHWDEDRDFDLEPHFKHRSLPKPGRIR